MKNYKDLYGNLVLGDFPNITAKNASGPGATDGTPYERSLIDDIWGIFQDVLSSVGLTPDGIAEAAGSSQFMEALRRGAGIPPGIILPVVMSPARLALMRMLKMEGQVVEVAAYPRLVDAIWEGASKNATVPAFYRCDNNANKTRNAAGTHLYLPDMRGIFLRGAGANSEHYASANTPYDGNGLGSFNKHRTEAHTHNITVLENFGGVGGSNYNIGTEKYNAGNYTRLGVIDPNGVEVETAGAWLAVWFGISY